MEDFLKAKFADVSMKRKLDIGIVDVKDGSYRDFSEKNITSSADGSSSSWGWWGSKSKESDNTLAEALYASMSFAGFFPPADVLGSYYFDGSAVWDIDIFSAINRCTEMGFTNKDIVVDVIMTSSANLKDVQAEDYKSIQMLFRYLEISSFYNSMDGLLRAKFAYEGVNFRCVITPSENIPSSLFPMNMSTKQIDAAFELG